MNKLYVGVSGFARSGKNLFCDIAQKVLKEKYNLTSKTYALAYFLKKDCEPFIQEKLGLSAFSEKTEDKNAFRDMWVDYCFCGDVGDDVCGVCGACCRWWSIGRGKSTTC